MARTLSQADRAITFSVHVLVVVANRSLIARSTLRANNRALAQALENAKQENRMLNQALVEEKAERQNIMLKLTTLNRVAGLTNDTIEAEVQKRFDVCMNSSLTRACTDLVVCLETLFSNLAVVGRGVLYFNPRTMLQFDIYIIILIAIYSDYSFVICELKIISKQFTKNSHY